MKEVTLTCEVRETTGKGPNRRLRAAGKLPGIIYGKATQPVPISLNTREFAALAVQGLSGKLIRLNFKDGANAPQKTVVLKEIQRSFREGALLHVDFQEVSLTDRITTKVPVLLTGEDRRKSDGGILEHHLWELEIQAIPTAIPEKIEVDVSGLTVGDTLKVSDIKLAPDIKVVTDGDEPVVSVVLPTRAEEPVAAGAPAEGAGAAAEAGAGAQPAKPGASNE